MARAEAERYFSEGRGVLALWVGVLTGPIVWLALLEANFILVPWACAAAAKWPMYLTTIVALAAVAGGALLSLRGWRETGAEWPEESAGVIPRSRFMAAGGLLLNVFFFLAIIAHGLPTLILGACQ